MLRVALVALLATSACRISLEDEEDPSTPDGGRACTVSTTNAECLQAAEMPAVSQTLTWIESNIFTRNCGTTACHSPNPGGGLPGGDIVLTTNSHTALVNVDTKLATGRKLVVPNDVGKSYLMVLMRHLTLQQADPAPAPAPRDNLYMPLNSPPVCCQKLDALERWIMNGALDN